MKQTKGGARTRQPSGKLSAMVNDERLRAILTVDEVTELLEDSFGIGVTPLVLYQGEPYIYPREVSKYFTAESVVQRDIRIEVPCDEKGAVKTVLFARSWIAVAELDEEFRELLCAGKMTIGRIIRKRRLNVEYRNLGYKEVRSVRLAAAFGRLGTIRLIRRSRVICHNKRPVILIHEFIPV